MEKDFYTGKDVPKSYLVELREFRGSNVIVDKRNLTHDAGGRQLHIYDSRVVKDCVDSKYYLYKELSYQVLIKASGTNRVGHTQFRDLAIKIIPGIPYKTKTINYALNEQVCIDLGYEESIFDGCFFDPSKDMVKSKKPIKYRRFEKTKIGDSKSEKIKFGEFSPTNKITEGKQYTFGIEIETSAGYIPPYASKNLNISSEYDGSIRSSDGKKDYGGEYVSGVLTGDAGFKHVYEIFKELSKRCEINKSCSFHVHVGNLNFNKRMIVASWKLNQMLEAEIFDMLPPSRRERIHCKLMKKVKFVFDKKLSSDMNINKLYRNLFYIVSLGKYPSKTVNKEFNHPAGHRCGYDTNTPRYWWINYVPTMFNLKGKENYTIEYRPHSATLNFTKAKNWILIVMGIVYVAENYSELIFKSNKFSLAEVLKLAYPLKHKYLINYIEERKEAFSGRSNLMEGIEYNVEEIVKNKIKYHDAVWD